MKKANYLSTSKKLHILHLNTFDDSFLSNHLLIATSRLETDNLKIID